MCRWMVLSLLLMAIALSCHPRPTLAGEKLSQARSEVRGSDRKSSSSSASSSESHSSSSQDSDDDSDSSFLGSFFGSLLSSMFSSDSEPECENADGSSSFTLGADVLLMGVTSPLWIPKAIVGDNDAELVLAEYPYKAGWDGYFVDQNPEPGWTKHWSGRFLAESGTDFDGLQKHGGRLRLDTASRFGLDTEWNYRREALSSGHDSLWNGDANLVYRFAQSPHGAFYTGLGVNWLSDRFGGNAGFNFTYGADFYPATPWVLSGVIDWGTLGNATLFHGRATVGVMLKRVEVFTGYDYLKLDGASLSSVVAGLQIHF